MQGAHLIYFSPYSPDFNLIKKAFSAIKVWLCCNEGRMTGDDQLLWLVHQTTLTIMSDDAVAWFRDCSYI